MKKFYFLLFFLSLSIASKAQWEITHHEGNELKDEKAYNSIMYSCPIGCFVTWDNTDTFFRLTTNEGIFNYDMAGGGKTFQPLWKAVKTYWGIYDESDKLIEKGYIYMQAQDDKASFIETPRFGKMFAPVGNYKKGKKIINYLLNKKGYVRFTAAIYGGFDFDIKVPCKNN